MSDLLFETQGSVQLITLNRQDKHNAFDDVLLTKLQHALDESTHNPNIHIMILKAHGKNFSAGADLQWMQRMVNFSAEENLADAEILARLMYTIYHCPKPIIAMVQGAAFGGGAGLVAACPIAIAANNASFCFSEVKLGLIPAVISPYVIRAIGERASTWLFTTAETFTAQQALTLGLIQHCVPEDELLTYTLNYAQQMAQLAPLARQQAKLFVQQVAGKPIDETLQRLTAAKIAHIRTSEEAQHGLKTFLNKKHVQ